MTESSQDSTLLSTFLIGIPYIYRLIVEDASANQSACFSNRDYDEVNDEFIVSLQYWCPIYSLQQQHFQQAREAYHDDLIDRFDSSLPHDFKQPLHFYSVGWIHASRS